MSISWRDTKTCVSETRVEARIKQENMLSFSLPRKKFQNSKKHKSTNHLTEPVFQYLFLNLKVGLGYVIVVVAFFSLVHLDF